MLLKVRQGWEDSSLLGPGLHLREIAIYAPAPAPVLMEGSCPWELSQNSKPTEGAEVFRRGKENRQSAKTGLQVVKTSMGSGGEGSVPHYIPGRCQTSRVGAGLWEAAHPVLSTWGTS